MSVVEICLARRDFQQPHLILLNSISNSKQQKSMSDTITLSLGSLNIKINTLRRFLYLSEHISYCVAHCPRMVSTNLKSGYNKGTSITKQNMTCLNA